MMTLRASECRRPARPRRGFRPEVAALEGRALLAITVPVTFDHIAGVPGADGFFRSPVTLTFTPFESGFTSSQLTTFFRVNNGPLVQGKSVTLAADGFYSVSFVSADPAGRFGSASSQFIAIDRTPPTVVAFASPTSLWPPNNKFDPVTVTGHVHDNLSGPGSVVFYSVVDSEGMDQPSGFAFVDRFGNFSFTVDLQASRLGQDKSGRVYTIDVFGVDRAGNVGLASTMVVVPHDQGHGGGDDGPGDDGKGPHGKDKGKGHD